MSEAAGTSRCTPARWACADSVRRRGRGAAGTLSALSVLAQPAQELTRDGAREEARRELGKGIYRDDSAIVDRVFGWIAERVGEVFELVSGAPGSSGLGAVLLVAVVVLLLVAARLGLGPLRPRDLLGDRRRGVHRMSAADYRAEATAFAARGEWREAVRSRFRAVIRELEEHGVLDPRAGRTAGEIAAEAGDSVPGIAADMRTAADIFNAIWYGDRPATEAAYQRMSQVDDAVRSGRLAVRPS
ncbi:MAG TPA: DUF4129 domain-containing protein [Mycobacteriales bacterium]|nr:DUF4129 domain-containing protein [Mycobacteriales bacterium]